MDTRKLLRVIVNFLWIKYNQGKLTVKTMFRIIDILQVPTPTEWREEYEKYRKEREERNKAIELGK